MEKEKLKKIIIENRRAGKTYLMYQVAKDIVATKRIISEQILFIGFEDERFLEVKAKDFDYSSSYFKNCSNISCLGGRT